jgi:hypothetical protein
VAGPTPTPSNGEQHEATRYRIGARRRPKGDVDAEAEGAVDRALRHDGPLYNRRFLKSRLAYRIQELAYGGLKPKRSAG